MRKWTVLELVGVALIAAALAFVHVGYAIGAVGVYLLVTAILQQVTGQERRDVEDSNG